MGVREDPLATMCSLTFATQPQLQQAPAMASEPADRATGSAFTIPLTLGMCDFAEAQTTAFAAPAAPAQPWPPPQAGEASVGTKRAAGQVPSSAASKRRK
eukprot:1344468-Alexandrium_andersonii.AAC.1